MFGSLAAAALGAGLLGGVHCAGMCGGIVGALASQARRNPTASQFAFNAGRIASYCVAGAVAGALGGVAQAGSLLTAQVALFALANALVILLGLYVAGWSAAVLRLERAGTGLWRRIEPAARRVLPIDSVPRALAAGALWGWVPCGLVYSMLALAAASGSAAGGIEVMLAFGLATLPNLLAAGLAAQRVLAIRRLPWVRRCAGGLIVTLGVIGLARIPGLSDAVLAGWLCI